MHTHTRKREFIDLAEQYTRVYLIMYLCCVHLHTQRQDAAAEDLLLSYYGSIKALVYGEMKQQNNKRGSSIHCVNMPTDRTNAWKKQRILLAVVCGLHKTMNINNIV